MADDVVRQLIELLPQQYPFRFVDRVTRYVKGRTMTACFHPLPFYPYLGKGDEVPITVQIEGLAQVAVLFTQMETQPLEAGEVPLLGKIDAQVTRPAVWDRILLYELSPVRIWRKQAIFRGTVRDDRGRTLLAATLGVAIAVKGGEEP